MQAAHKAETANKTRALRVDLHAHSNASAGPVFHALAFTGCPESYSEPERVYALAKRRGMDAIAITDHDTIAGALAMVEAGYPDVIVGEEATVRFPEDGCAIHVLLWGLTPELHDEIDLLNLRDDVRGFAAWVRQAQLPHALAHPLHAQNGRLRKRHLEQLALLFRGFETLNGAHGGLHRPTERFVDALTSEALSRLAQKHGFSPLYEAAIPRLRTAGSDDHALLNVGRTWTEIDVAGRSGGERPANWSDASSAALAGLRRGATRPCGAEGSPEGLAHQVLAVAAQHAARALPAPASPRRRLALSRLCRLAGADLPPPSRSALALQHVRRRLAGKRRRPRSFLPALGQTLTQTLRSYPELALKADPARWTTDDPPIADDERFARFVSDLFERVVQRFADDLERAWTRRRGRELVDAGLGLLAAHAALAPYAFAMFYQHKDAALHRSLESDLSLGWPAEPDMEQAPRTDEAHRPARLALFTDTALETNGVSRFVRDFAAHALARGWDARIFCAPTQRETALAPPFAPLRPIASFETPGYKGLRVGIPPALALLRAVRRFGPDVVHISTPGPTGLLGAVAAAMLRAPALGTHHTDFPAYAERLLGDASLTGLTRAGLRLLYTRFAFVLARSEASTSQLRALGVAPERVRVIPPGVDTERFTPSLRDRSVWRSVGVDPQSVIALYVGRVSKEKNTDALADVWTRMRRRAQAHGARVALVVVGDGPARRELERRLGALDARFVGEKHGQELARLYASADLFLFPSVADTLGQVVLEAQASGLPAIVSDVGGPATIVRDGATGFIAPPAAAALWADRAGRLIEAPELRARMGAAARAAMEQRSLARSLDAFYAAHVEALARRSSHSSARRRRRR